MRRARRAAGSLLLLILGTKIDGAFLAMPFRMEPGDEGHQSFTFSVLIWPFVLVDLPLSVILDTVLLPYTLRTDTKAGTK